MLKIFLVEDEFIVREGIKNNIDWAAHGYDFCGEASDGEVALPMIQKCKPDLVITDIKMPFMDGLTLSKLIKKEFPWMEIILLSGYQDFKYAQEGIKIGVAEYLSKPINGNDLLKAIEQVEEKSRQHRSEWEMREKYEKEMAENTLQERKNFFQYLVDGSKPLAELLGMAEQLEMNISAIWYNIVLLNLQSIHHAKEEYSKSLVELENKLLEIPQKDRVLVFDRGLEGMAYLFMADSEKELKETQDSYLNHVKAILQEYDWIRYFGGVGMPVNRLSKLASCYEKASRMYAHRFFVEENAILESEAVEENLAGADAFDVNHVNAKTMDRRRILRFLRVGDREETIYFVEEFFKDLGMNVVASNMFRQYIAMDAYFCVISFMEEMGLPRESVEIVELNSGILANVDATMSYVTRIIAGAIGMRENAASNRYGNVVEEIMKYVEDHYDEDELSLNQMASHVNFSPSHLSMIFSQQTGGSLIKYLTDYRMARAKELLRCTNKRSSEIAVEVGYKDSHYFSYLFKKQNGMTPTQYREHGELEGVVNE